MQHCIISSPAARAVVYLTFAAPHRQWAEAISGMQKKSSLSSICPQALPGGRSHLFSVVSVRMEIQGGSQLSLGWALPPHVWHQNGSFPQQWRMQGSLPHWFYFILFSQRPYSLSTGLQVATEAAFPIVTFPQGKNCSTCSVSCSAALPPSTKRETFFFSFLFPVVFKEHPLLKG